MNNMFLTCCRMFFWGACLSSCESLPLFSRNPDLSFWKSRPLILEIPDLSFWKSQTSHFGNPRSLILENQDLLI